MDEGHFKAVLDQAPDAVIVADRGGLISYWNEGAQRIFGQASEEAMGQRLDIIIPEQFREAHWRGFERALAEGETKYRGQVLPTRAMRSDGETIYVELSFAIVKEENGEVFGALAFARDITERFNRDREMRRRLRDLEAAQAPANST